MFDVYIADDESIFREYLKTVINWQDYGFRLAGEAKNGQELVDLVDKKRADIIFADINMPELDGLLAAEIIHKKYNDIIIVLVTGYNEFEYARRAIGIGVNDFILKPFSKDELLSILLKQKKRLQILGEEKSLHRKEQKLLREFFLRSLIDEENMLNVMEVRQQLSRYDLTVKTENFRVSSIEIDFLYDKFKTNNEIRLWKNAVLNILEESIEIGVNHFAFLGAEDRIISVLELEDYNLDNNITMGEYTGFSENVKKYLGFSVSVGIGEVKSGLENIKVSYRQSITVLQSKLLYGSGKVMLYNELSREYQNIGFYAGELNRKIEAALRIYDVEGVDRILNQVCIYIIGQHLQIEYVYVISLGLLSICFSHITENNKDIKEVLGEDISAYIDIHKKSSIEDVFEDIKEVYRKTIEFFNHNKYSRSRKTAYNVKKYIEENYTKPELTVEQIAAGLYVDSSYLRRTFKKEFNMKITDFLTQIRMEKARELLVQDRYKLSDISEMVGFNDSSYLSKVFKKYFGKSPSEYYEI